MNILNQGTRIVITAPANAENTLTLYSTDGCHLCEIAEDLLLPWTADEFCIQVIDIAENDALMDTFGLLIPVLERFDGAKLNWPFTQSDIQAFLYEHIE